MANLITIEQLLESVDLDFEPRWITKDEEGIVEIWPAKPYSNTDLLIWSARNSSVVAYVGLKLAEFENKDWTECIYEVPRKTTGKIKKIEVYGTLTDYKFKPTEKFEPMTFMELIKKINELIDAVNELKGAKNE